MICMLMSDLCFCFSFSYTTIYICGEGPTLTKLSATNCRLLSRVQVGNPVKLGWVTTSTIPRFVSFLKKTCPQASLPIILTHAKHRPKRLTHSLLKGSYILLVLQETTTSNKSCKPFVEANNNFSFSVFKQSTESKLHATGE